MSNSVLEQHLQRCLDSKSHLDSQIRGFVDSAIRNFSDVTGSLYSNFTFEQGGFDIPLHDLKTSNRIANFNLVAKVSAGGKSYTVRTELFATIIKYMDGSEGFILSSFAPNPNSHEYDGQNFSAMLRTKIEDEITNLIFQ